jgi:Protein of unknown function (DUF2917)
MQRDTDTALTRLAHGTLLTLPRGAGRGIAVFAGLVWVTEERDLRDHFLGAGDSLVLQGNGRVVVQAFGAARLLVFETQTAAAA